MTAVAEARDTRRICEVNDCTLIARTPLAGSRRAALSRCLLRLVFALSVTVLWLIPAFLLNGQTATSTDSGESRQAFEASIAKQRDAIERQMMHYDPREVSARFLQVAEVSIEKQRASVQRQLDSAKPRAAVFPPAWPPVMGVSSVLPDSDCWRIQPSELEDYVEKVATREGLAADLLQVVIDRESGYWPCAVSTKGAMGLMQLMPATAGELGVQNPFDPKENIAAGARYLNSLLRRFGNDVVLALAAYNAGPTTVDEGQGVPSIPETQNYVSDIIEELRSRPLSAAGTRGVSILLNQPPLPQP